MQTYIHTCMHIFVRFYLLTYTNTWHTYKNAYMHTCMLTYTNQIRIYPRPNLTQYLSENCWLVRKIIGRHIFDRWRLHPLPHMVSLSECFHPAECHIFLFQKTFDPLCHTCRKNRCQVLFTPDTGDKNFWPRSVWQGVKSFSLSTAWKTLDMVP